jgi:hypothetical protein
MNPESKCGCCEGIEQLTPLSTANRPGLPALGYRAGTHASFFETMKARLTNLCLGTEERCKAGKGLYPLAGLTTRESSDPSIALLDAAATVGDVLTFYQERTANEGYLRTATQRRSIVELARLVGYKPRPGVAASVRLAFLLEDDSGEIIIPKGTGAKSIPGQDESPQTFETFEDLKARPEWNELKPRLTRPTKITIENSRNISALFFEGTSTNLSVNDNLVLVIGDARTPVLRKVRTVEPDFDNERTRVGLQPDLLASERFVKKVEDEILNFLREIRFAEAPVLAGQIYGELQQFVVAELKSGEKLVDIEKDVHDYISSPTGLAERQVWCAELSIEGFAELAGTDKPLSNLSADLTKTLTDLADTLGARCGETVSLNGTIQAESDVLGAKLNDFRTNDLSSPPAGSGARDEAREKATEISHELQQSAARLESDEPFVLTTARAPLEYGLGEGARAVDKALYLSRPDGTDPADAYSVEVRIAANYVVGEDQLRFTDVAPVSHTQPSDDVLVLNAGASATLAQFQEALRTVTYENTNASGTTVRRTITFSLIKSAAVVATNARVIEIDGDDSGHSLKTTFAPLRYSVGGGESPIDDGLEIDNAVSGTSDQFRADIKIAKNFTDSEDELRFTNTSKIEHAPFNPVDGTISVNVVPGETVSAHEFRDVLRNNLTYCNTNNASSPLSRTIVISFSDGSYTAMASRDVDIGTSALTELKSATLALKKLIDDKSATFGKSGPPTIPAFYRTDSDSLDASIEAFQQNAFAPAIESEVTNLLSDLVTNLGMAATLIEKADVVDSTALALDGQKAAAAGKEVLVDRIAEVGNLLVNGIATEIRKDVADNSQNLKGTYEIAVAPILSDLGGPATPPGAEFGRFLDEIDLITSELPTTDDGLTLQDRAQLVQNVVVKLNAMAGTSENARLGFEELSEDIKTLRVQLWRFSAEVRDEFRKRVLREVERGLLLFSGISPVEDRLQPLKNTLTTVLSLGEDPPTDPGKSFGDPLHDYVETCQAELNRNVPNSLADVLEDQSISLGNLATVLRSLIRELEVAVGQVATAIEAESAPQDRVVTPDIIGLLNQFAQLGDDASGRSRLLHDFRQTFSSNSDTILQLLKTLKPELRNVLYEVWRSLAVELGGPRPEVHALRKRANLFGYNAPKELQDLTEVIVALQNRIGAGVPGPLTTAQLNQLKENIQNSLNNLKSTASFEEPAILTDGTNDFPEEDERLFLDAVYDGMLPESYVAIQTPADDAPRPFTVRELASHPRTAYGISTQTTDTRLTESWWSPGTKDQFDVIRGTVVYAESQELKLAEEPIEEDVPLDASNTIELGALYDGFDAPRKMIVGGERTDIPSASGVIGQELIEVIGVEQTIDLQRAGDTIHTRLVLAEPLRHSYKRDTLSIHGNVVVATHGETQREVLGSGNASQTFQKFRLANSPLTFLAAPTPSGAADTLTVRVNDVEWNQCDGFAGRKPKDRVYVTDTDSEQHTTVLFGDGEYGARLPTGAENVTAEYRTGIGKAGNVRAGQISQLATQPLGVKGVINPLRASGGGNPETPDQARDSAPLPVMALDRLVSVQDYADFARTFAGISKASATRLTDGRRQAIHITIAGADDVPIDSDSELFENLSLALRDHGDSQHVIELETRELKLLVIDAGVKVLSGYRFEKVEKEIRTALLREFSFERRALGQDITSSEVISVFQSIAGVEFVDIEKLDAVEESITPAELSGLACRITRNPRVTVRGARTRETFRRRINIECTLGQFIDAYAISPVVDPDNSANDKSALKVLQELNPGVLDGIVDDDINTTFRELVESAKLNLHDAEILTVKSPEESGIFPAQLAYLSPDVPDTLILSEIR